MKRFLFNLLRVAVSVGLLSYLIYQANPSQTLNVLRRAEVFYLGLAVFLFCLVVVVLSLRWHTLLDSLEKRPGLGKLVLFYLIGFFFNNFLPTAIGGDVSRIYYLTRESGDRSLSIGSVFMERVLGLLATLTLASISLIWVREYFYSDRIVFVTFGLVFIVVFVLGNILNRFLYGKTSQMVSKITILGLGAKINEVFSRLHGMRESGRSVLAAFGLSLASQFLLILMNFSLARGLGLDQVSLGFLLLVIPVTFVITLIPSINGLGVRDFGYVFLLTRVGVSEAEALSLSILSLMVPVLISIAGGVMLIFYRQKTAGQGDQEEENPAMETQADNHG